MARSRLIHTRCFHLFCRPHRQMAHRQLCLYIHRGQRLGKNNRRVIAACAVNKIRKTIPEDDGQYIDFQGNPRCTCRTVFDIGGITISDDCPRVFTFSYNILCAVQFQNAHDCHSCTKLYSTDHVANYLDCYVHSFTYKTNWNLRKL